ncbi:MAG TPA: alpha/beta hydrolase [Candidatus Dormibacteraeota bacterium]|nr:alpha/beta hydrolase [Candidatus Dormibacteraeota bacterium]
MDGALYVRSGPRPATALVIMHPTVSFLHHYALIPLAERGYAALGLNSRFAGNEAQLLIDKVVLDLAAGVAELRERGFEHVVLVGNSGGGALAAFYQAHAEEPARPLADAVIILNAHRGRPQVLTAWLDPSVTDEWDPLSANPSLDMFDQSNGPPYRSDFVERYRAAQEARNRRITAWAQERLESAGDQAFVVHRTAADLRFVDLALDPSDRAVGTYWGPDVRAANYAAGGLARFSTLRSWLSQWGLDTSPAPAEPSLARCYGPMLFIQGTADQGIFPSDARALFEAAASEDKQLSWIRGGSHYFLGQPDLQREVYDMIESWLGARDMPAPR